MSWSRVKELIRAHFDAVITVPNELVVKLGNEPAAGADEQWARLSIRGAARRLAATGAPSKRKWRRAGVIFAQLFVPLGEGDEDLEDLVDQVEAAFIGQQLVDATEPKVVVRCGAPFADGEAAKDSDTWWFQLVTIPFEADEYGGAAP